MKQLLLIITLLCSLAVVAQPPADPVSIRVSALFDPAAQPTHPVLIQYYKACLLQDIKTTFNYNDSVAESYLNKKIQEAYKKPNDWVSKKSKAIFDRQIEAVKDYRIQYGNYLKPLYIKNAEVSIEPSQLVALYNHTNSVIFDSLANRLEDVRDKYIGSRVRALKNSAIQAERTLYNQIKNGNTASITNYFSKLNKTIEDEYKATSDQALAAFQSATQTYNATLQASQQKVDDLIERAIAFKDSSAQRVGLILDAVTNDVKLFSDQYVAVKLSEVLKDGNTVLFEKIRNHDPAALTTFLSGIQKQAQDNFTKALSTQAKNIVSFQSEFAEGLKSNKKKLDDFIDKASTYTSIISDGELDYKKLVNVLPVVSNTITRLQGSLQQKQAELQSKLVAFHDKYVKEFQAKTEAALFLASFFSDVKDTRSALLELKNSTPLSPDLLKAKEELIKAKGSFIEDAKGYLQTADLVLNSLQVLGVKSKLVGDLSKGIAIANGVMNTVAAFASGNYIGAVSGALGMFGGSKSDPAAERHKQVMEALQRIDGKLNAINEKLDAILKNQQAMFELQKKTYEEVVSLRQTVLDEFDKLNIKVDNLDQKINHLIKQSFETEHLHCRTAAADLQLTIDNNNMPGRERIAQTWDQYPSTQKEAIERFFNDHPFLNSENKINLLYRSSVYDYTDLKETGDLPRKFDTFYTNLLQKSYEVQKWFYQNSGDHKLYSSLQSPLFTYQEVNYKLKQPAIERTSKMLDPKLELKREHINSYVSTRAAIVTADMILKLHPVIAITDDEHRVVKADDRFLHNLRIAQTVKYLKNSLLLVNASLAQQNLLSGDFVLEGMRRQYKDFFANSTDSTIYKGNNALLKNVFGETLFYNFIRYYIWKEIDQSNNSLSLAGYTYAFNQPKEGTLMNTKTVKFPFPIVYLDSAAAKAAATKTKRSVDVGWNANIEGIYRAMPSPLELQGMDGFRLAHTPELFTLLDYRDRLVNCIESYNLFTGASIEDRQVLNYLYIK